MPASRRPDRGPSGAERFRPGGVLHAVVSGLSEAALALVLLGCSQLAGDGNPGVAAALSAAAALWAVLAGYSLATGALRARVWEAAVDGEGVVVRGLAGARRWRFDELSAVEVGGGRTRLVARDGRTRRVRAVRGVEQGRRFRASVLARASEAVRPAPGRPGPAPASPGRLPAGAPDDSGVRGAHG
jgi:hypothetical protein